MNKKISNRLSKSKIKSFKQCPRQLYLTQTYPEEIVKGEALIRGTELHDILDKLYSYNIDFKDKEQVYKTLLNLDTQNKYTPQLNLFVDWLELLEFPVPENTEEKIYDKQDDIVIMYDRIDYDGEKRVLWDYKTGKKKNVNEFKFELMMYAYYFMKQKRKQVHYVGIYFIDYGTFDMLPVTKKDLQEVVADIHNEQANIREAERNNVFPAKLQFFCKWCPVNHICEKYQKYGR
ncbi:MAG: PD-(D/E)XK nuclease family protein [Candidatus Woesearchaeota archaeon]